LHYIFEIGQLL